MINLKKIYLLICVFLFLFSGLAIKTQNNKNSEIEQSKDTNKLLYVSLKSDVKIDYIEVIKHKRIMTLYQNSIPIKSYVIGLGLNPIGKKRFEGDMKTPEGLYFIDAKNPKSLYYLNLGISYPNNDDIDYAKHKGKQAGGDIKIHGFPNGDESVKPGEAIEDWTYGCIAVSNESIEELYKIIEINTPINIKK